MSDLLSCAVDISIHALRGEGDIKFIRLKIKL